MGATGDAMWFAMFRILAVADAEEEEEDGEGEVV